MSLSHNKTTITDATHINALLGRLFKNHCSVEVKEVNSSGAIKTLGMSEILNFKPDEDTILFDAIPSTQLKSNKHIKIFTKFQGVEIHFNAIVTKTTERSHSFYFNTKIPKEIVHKQRRQQYRAVLQNLWKIPVSLIDNTHSKIQSAYIYNISTGGISIRSTTEDLTKIANGVIIDTIIQLPENNKIECQLQVRQTQSNAEGGFQQLSGQFLNMNSKNEKIIQSFVNKVERKSITSQSELHSTE